MLQAKWVLDHHGLVYKMTQYTPGLGEGWLRKKSGKKGGMVTTPALFTPDGAHVSAIAQHTLSSPCATKRSPLGWCCYIRSDLGVWDSKAT